MSLPASNGDRGAVRSRWTEGLGAEIQFWGDWIESRGLEWQAEFRDRLDPHRPLQPHLRGLIDVPPGSTIRILDVGSGPLTNLGKKWDDRRIEIVAADPLADEYNRSMEAAGIVPLVRPVRVEAERLTEVFAEGAFDLSHALNCLDHCHDPVEAIRQMLLVTRPGAWVQLDHAVNEAVRQSYTGLHQWNLCIEDGRLICWRPGVRVDVCEAVRDLTRETRIVPRSDWVSVGFRRGGATNPGCTRS